MLDLGFFYFGFVLADFDAFQQSVDVCKTVFTRVEHVNEIGNGHYPMLKKGLYSDFGGDDFVSASANDIFAALRFSFETEHKLKA